MRPTSLDLEKYFTAYIFKILNMAQKGPTGSGAKKTPADYKYMIRCLECNQKFRKDLKKNHNLSKHQKMITEGRTPRWIPLTEKIVENPFIAAKKTFERQAFVGKEKCETVAVSSPEEETCETVAVGLSSPEEETCDTVSVSYPEKETRETEAVGLSSPEKEKCETVAVFSPVLESTTPTPDSKELLEEFLEPDKDR